MRVEPSGDPGAEQWGRCRPSMATTGRPGPGPGYSTAGHQVSAGLTPTAAAARRTGDGCRPRRRRSPARVGGDELGISGSGQGGQISGTGADKEGLPSLDEQGRRGCRAGRAADTIAARLLGMPSRTTDGVDVEDAGSLNTCSSAATRPRRGTAHGHRAAAARGAGRRNRTGDQAATPGQPAEACAGWLDAVLRRRLTEISSVVVPDRRSAETFGLRALICQGTGWRAFLQLRPRSDPGGFAFVLEGDRCGPLAQHRTSPHAIRCAVAA